MLFFAIFTTILSYILLKYIKLTLDPIFQIDHDRFCKIIVRNLNIFLDFKK